jgi:nicotinate-nucleotide adenylyltransferase
VIGLYGGTFDPIHNGHLHVIKELLSSKRFEKIIIVPSGNPQLRAAPIAASEDRLALVQLAISEVKMGDLVAVSDYEIKKDGPSYAIDTARYFMEIYPGTEFSWIIGSDAFSKIDQWRESEALMELISFIVIERPMENLEVKGSKSTSPLDSKIHSKIPSVIDEKMDEEDEYDSYGYEDIDALTISATNIREKLSKHESITELVPQSVEKYIIERKLYGSA